MSTTPLMGLIIPDDHDATEADIWGLILNVALGLVDSHNHTPGRGGQVPTTGLKIDADISWSFGGASRAITDLRAIDFSPQAASGMTALAGALFLNSADNELYYRTTSGVNVKVTSGAALNIAGFTGGIGGDYAATGALVSYDDATDTYIFQQQVGASVRQFARLRSADLDLFEFKANPTAGVPTNRIRLQSPAALASSYAITLPTALPASTTELLISTSGVIGFSVPVHTQILPALGGISSNAFGTISGSTIIRTGASGGTYYRQLQFDAGQRFVNVRVRLKDAGGTTCTATLVRDVDGVQSTISTIGTSAGTAAYQTLTATAINHTVIVGGQYAVAFTFGGAAANCDLDKIEVDYDRP